VGQHARNSVTVLRRGAGEFGGARQVGPQQQFSGPTFPATRSGPAPT